MISLNHYRRVAYRGYVKAAEGWVVLAMEHKGTFTFYKSLEGHKRAWDYVIEQVDCPQGNLFVFDTIQEP